MRCAELLYVAMPFHNFVLIVYHYGNTAGFANHGAVFRINPLAYLALFTYGYRSWHLSTDPRGKLTYTSTGAGIYN
jgi:hypothetical protein